MFRILLSLSLVLGLVVSLPKPVAAQSQCGHCGKCATCVKYKPCTKCKKPKCHCVCAPVQMTTKPVYETCYRKEQQVTCKTFVETHMKDELYLETVPVTKYDCVTVDEGGYQQVWVPKIVTKQVARTEYVNRTACRQVPYQVTKTVPEVTTKMVPYQRVRYVQAPSTCVPGLIVGTSSYPPAMYAPSDPSCASPAGPTCASPSSPAMAPTPVPPAYEDFSNAPTPTFVPNGAAKPTPANPPAASPAPTPAAPPPPPANPMDLPMKPMNTPAPMPGGKTTIYQPNSGYPTLAPPELNGGISPQVDPRFQQSPTPIQSRPAPQAMRSYPSAAPVWQSNSNRTAQYH